MSCSMLTNQHELQSFLKPRTLHTISVLKHKDRLCKEINKGTLAIPSLSTLSLTRGD